MGKINLPADEFQITRKLTASESVKILRTLKSKKWKGVDFRKDKGAIGFYVSIDFDVKDANAWNLHVLTIPDLKEPDHEHYHFNYREIKSIHSFLGRLLNRIETLKQKK